MINLCIIKLVGIDKTYGSGNIQLKALNNINLTINKGELIAITGPSGSGKTTLLNIIGTLDKPSGGNYLLDNKSVYDLKSSQISKLRNKYFGFIVQHFALISDYTVFENLQIPLEYGRVKYISQKKIIAETLNNLGLKDKIHKTPKQLSGGQCQRVAIARALVNSPEIMQMNPQVLWIRKTVMKF